TMVHWKLEQTTEGFVVPFVVHLDLVFFSLWLKQRLVVRIYKPLISFFVSWHAGHDSGSSEYGHLGRPSFDGTTCTV
ncbi:hypothetical protein HAX54_049282, partial [Datura stramonium]|nr:hypothetical protein [Datura stramonium]